MSVAEIDTHAVPAVDSSAEVIPFPMPHARLGRAMEMGADVLVGVRTVGAVGVNAYIRRTPDYHSWGLAASFAGFAATDAVDGWLARTGRRLQGKDESVRRPLKAYPDQLADKALTDGTAEAIGERELRNGNQMYGTVVMLSAGVTVGRDVATTIDRIWADIDNIDTRAQKGGKRKALQQFVTTTVALTPLAKNPVAQAGLALAFAHCANESVRSGLDLHRSFTEQRQALRTEGQTRWQQWKAQRENRTQAHANAIEGVVVA